MRLGVSLSGWSKYYTHFNLQHFNFFCKVCEFMWSNNFGKGCDNVNLYGLNY